MNVNIYLSIPSVMDKKQNTRNNLCPDVDFPPLKTEEWKLSGHLLTFSELIGGIRGLVSTKFSYTQACTAISNIAVSHWSERNISTI